MASLGDVGELTEGEYADLDARVDRFHASWKPDGSSALEEYVPAIGARHRLFVLVELIKTDMELRAKAGLPFRVDTYLDQFRGDLSAESAPLSLIVEEYRLRHRHADKPRPDEYRARFPNQFDAFQKYLAANAGLLSASPPPKRQGSIGFESMPIVESTPNPDRNAPTKVTPAPPVKPASSTARPSGTFASGPAQDILPADLQYRLIRRIGKGAFGEVYEALAPGGFRVAVKRILRSVDHPATQGDLEALEAIKSMSHPFLLQTHAYWVLEDRLILVMDLAEGSLAERVEFHRKRGLPGVPPEEIVPFFEQAAEALDYLHSQHVSHRDVKPENLLHLKGYAKVADFGLARAQEHLMTTVGMEVGTPAYMAPEVCGGKVSLHSDQYSLAATYVAARLGRTLYDTKLRYEMEHHHVNTIPKLDPLPIEEQKILLKALAKRPDDRYPSCLAFAKALRRALLDPAPAKSAGNRSTIAVALSAALVCGLTVGIIGWFLSKPPVVVATDPSKPETAANLWRPTGWNPVPEAGTQTVSNKDYHKRLTRTVAGETLVAILVVPTHPSDPDPFYMLENKISNKVFRHEWDRAEGNPASAVRRFRDTNLLLANDLLPGQWRKGAPELNAGSDGKPNRLGIEGMQADVPVVGVTVPEATLIAQELGGLLPTKKQWLKAVGLSGDGEPPGPAGPNVEGTTEEKIAELKRRNLALGLEKGPWSVEKPTPDRSYCGIHQLVSNGQEWTGDNPAGGRIDLAQLPTTEYRVPLVGQSWEMLTVPTFADVRVRLAEWDRWDQFAGFRIVLEPR